MSAQRTIHIVIPFYRNSHLVEPCLAYLAEVADEIESNNCIIKIYNDSPDCDSLRAAITESCARFAGLVCEIVDNNKNLGFLGTANKAMAEAKKLGADVILLNSDALVFPGAITEMISSARTDPLIGFCSPRSNNCTLATLPNFDRINEIPGVVLSPKECFKKFTSVSDKLNKFVFVPVSPGFCVFIKYEVLNWVGIFDPVYGKGYNEENDLMMRANEFGFRCILANKAFVYHEGSASFGNAKKRLEKKNSEILLSRYPYYNELNRAYYEGPVRRSEQLACELPIKSIAFECSHFGSHFNGTFELAIRQMEAFCRVCPKDIDLYCVIPEHALKFHGLATSCKRMQFLDPTDFSHRFGAVVRVGQPFSWGDIHSIFNRASVVSINMLDSIALDCGYISSTFDNYVWEFVARHTDVLTSISRFSLDIFLRRFPMAKTACNTIVNYPSLHSPDYKGNKIVSEIALIDGESLPEKFYLILGNHHKHKNIRRTLKVIARACPRHHFVVLGGSKDTGEFKNVTNLQSGGLSEELMDYMYQNCVAVIYPTLYEGFGLPIMRSLAEGKVIYLVQSILNQELADLVGNENIFTFSTPQDLAEQLVKEQIFSSSPSVCQHDWDAGASELLDALKEKGCSLKQKDILERMTALEFLKAKPNRSLTRAEVLVVHLFNRSGLAKLTRFLLRLVPHTPKATISRLLGI